MKTVYPIRDAIKLNEIIKGLADYQNEHERRIYLIFMIGICTGLRIGDIIGLKIGQVNKGDELRLIEEKTGKQQKIKINKQLRAVFDNELTGRQDDEYILVSRQRDRRGRTKHITTATAENDLKKVKYWFCIREPFSCHSLRKTYGYWHYKEHKNLPMLQKQFNHSSIAVTARYIGIDEEAMLEATESMYDKVFTIKRREPAKKRSNQVNQQITIKYHNRTTQKAAFAERMREGREKAQKIAEIRQQGSRKATTDRRTATNGQKGQN